MAGAGIDWEFMQANNADHPLTILHDNFVLKDFVAVHLYDALKWIEIRKDISQRVRVELKMRNLSHLAVDVDWDDIMVQLGLEKKKFPGSRVYGAFLNGDWAALLGGHWELDNYWSLRRSPPVATTAMKAMGTKGVKKTVKKNMKSVPPAFKVRVALDQQTSTVPTDLTLKNVHRICSQCMQPIRSQNLELAVGWTQLVNKIKDHFGCGYKAAEDFVVQAGYSKERFPDMQNMNGVKRTRTEQWMIKK